MHSLCHHHCHNVRLGSGGYIPEQVDPIESGDSAQHVILWVCGPDEPEPQVQLCRLLPDDESSDDAHSRPHSILWIWH